MATDVTKFGSVDVEDHDGSTAGLKLAGTLVTATAAEINNAVDGVLATAAEVNRVADVSTRIVTLTGDTTLTELAHDGKTLLLGEVGGNALLTVTLPAATGSGARLRFKVSVVNTSNYVIKVTGNDTMDGQLLMVTDAGDAVEAFEAASDSDTITLNGTTTGGASIGDWIELEDIAADQWAVTGILTGSGDEVTPFSATV